MYSNSYQKRCADFEWNIPATFNFGTDVVDELAAHADGTALLWENTEGESASYTFSEIAKATDSLAQVLRDAGLRKGDRIIVMLPRIPAWPISMVAALKIGAVPIPCIEMLTRQDLTFRIDHSGARGVICRTSQVEKFSEITDKLPVRVAVGGASEWIDYDQAVQTPTESFKAAVVEAEEPAVMYYTSGSTGHPKGVLHSSRALYAWHASADHWLNVSHGDRIWCTADTGWSKAGTSILFGPWARGACSLLYDGPFDVSKRLELLAKHRINVYCAPGTELFRMVDEDMSGTDLSALRRAVSAGEAVSPIIAQRWEKTMNIPIAEAYGQTEALMLVLNIPGEPVKYGSMGLPAPGSTVDILDAKGNRCADNVEGTIAVKVPNPQLMLGYWQDTERTQSVFVDSDNSRWYLTGDRAYRDEDGYLWFGGRDDDLINSSGYRIGPMEVENVLLEHVAVQECAVVGSPDDERGEVVKAFVVLRQGFDGTENLVTELQAHAKALTAPYKYPRRIEFVSELPRTLTGKIRRRALRDREFQSE